MSRSYAKHPHFSYTNGRDSEKEYKRLANRKLRRITKYLLDYNWEDEDLILPLMDEVANLYNFPSDGGGFYVVRDFNDDYYNDITFFKEFLRK